MRRLWSEHARQSCSSLSYCSRYIQKQQHVLTPRRFHFAPLERNAWKLPFTHLQSLLHTQKVPDGPDQFTRNGFLEALVAALFPTYYDPKLSCSPAENQLTEMVSHLAGADVVIRMHTM